MTHVLVLDGDEAIRASLRLLLEETGYTVVEAPDGRTALDLLSASPDCVVVLFDLVPVSPTGMQFLTQAAQLPQRHSYICMTTSPLLSVQAQELLARLVAPVLTKPFDVDHLLEIVHQGSERLNGNHATHGNRGTVRN